MDENLLLSLPGNDDTLVLSGNVDVVTTHQVSHSLCIYAD